jgi:hypothetical protein
MNSSLLESVEGIEFQITEAYSNLDLSNLKHSKYKHSKEENVKVMERMRSNGLMRSENINSKQIWKCNFESKKTPSP